MTATEVLKHEYQAILIVIGAAKSLRVSPKSLRVSPTNKKRAHLLPIPEGLSRDRAGYSTLSPLPMPQKSGTF